MEEAVAATATAASREQQREARRQKVLARSQGGHRAPVLDLATEQQISAEGAIADLDEPQDPPIAGTPESSPRTGDNSKSGARLAAERRRQRILSKSNERMAKVQGDRVMRSGGAGAGGASGGDSGLKEVGSHF